MRPVRFAPCAAGASPTISTRALGSPNAGTGRPQYSQSRYAARFSRATRSRYSTSRAQRVQVMIVWLSRSRLTLSNGGLAPEIEDIDLTFIRHCEEPRTLRRRSNLSEELLSEKRCERLLCIARNDAPGVNYPNLKRTLRLFGTSSHIISRSSALKAPLRISVAP